MTSIWIVLLIILLMIGIYGCHFFNEIKDLKTLQGEFSKLKCENSDLRWNSNRDLKLLQEEVSKLKREVFTLSKDSSKNLVEPHKRNVKNELKKTKKTVSSVTP